MAQKKARSFFIPFIIIISVIVIGLIVVFAVNGYQNRMKTATNDPSFIAAERSHYIDGCSANGTNTTETCACLFDSISHNETDLHILIDPSTTSDQLKEMYSRHTADCV